MGGSLQRLMGLSPWSCKWYLWGAGEVHIEGEHYTLQMLMFCFILKDRCLGLAVTSIFLSIIKG